MLDQSGGRQQLARGADGAHHPLITVGDAARLLNYSEMTIRRKIDARQMPAVKIGSKAMVPRAFVEQVLAAVAAGHTVVLEEFAAQWLQTGGAA